MSETQKEKAAAMPTIAKTTMVERVARAIYEGRNGAGCIPWARRDGAHRKPYLSDARAAIAAMRDPTPAIVEAVKPWPGHCWGQIETAGSAKRAAYLADQATATSSFTTMIDAALAEDPLPETKGIAAA
ncbi:hypothetical protein [Antarcticirhabdus aurantiaca]|uniref:hypothetical protein n=1 Tax=Antarcticirhabdus aurantiaca TaxID=2606717 RepID=UPI00131CD699|nr:hypothetical protein [Antarcticirhabdus aurantiaca]